MASRDSASPTLLTPLQVRAARAILAWSQEDLAKAAGVAKSTIADFERGVRKPLASNALAIRHALEKEGTMFLPGGVQLGRDSSPRTIQRPAVPEQRTMPVRWVGAEDLLQWADRLDAPGRFPQFLSHLIHATLGTAVQVRFPAEEGIRQPGWDGTSACQTGNAWVPDGHACWELSAQRAKIADKASRDYEKRTQNPGVVDTAGSTFVFVTLRDFPDKEEWAATRRAEGRWKDVRAYDVHNLVHWIEQAPAVGLWISTILNKRPEGTRELDDIWKEWSCATRWPLTADLVLADREESAARVRRWLLESPSVLSLQATTTEEALAFFHATLDRMPEEQSTAIRARTLVATTTVAARNLGNAPFPLALLLTEPDPGLAQSLAGRGHHVLQAYDDRAVGPGEVHRLERPSRESIVHALMSSGIAEPQAKRLARESARNLAVLRRRMSSSPGSLPAWAESPPATALLAALLAGGWNEAVEADCAVLESLADQSYDAISSKLVPYLCQLDSPVQKIGSVWHVSSITDAWMLLAKYLSPSHLTSFEKAARNVLGAADPRFDLSPDKRWKAAVYNARPVHSAELRHGIGQVLILLAIHGDRVVSENTPERRAGAIVRGLLQNADRQRWWSLSDNLRLLAEAAPEAFLSAVEDSLDRDEPPIHVLFESDGGPFGASHVSELMWALEVLAWSPELVSRVTHVLARLDAIDTAARQFSNGPAESLRQVHLLWRPQTHASLEQRLDALDRIRRQEPGAAWKLMLGILPRGHDVSSDAESPRWRDYTIEDPEQVTRSLFDRGATAISQRLLDDVGVDTKRWSDVLDRLNHLATPPESALEKLDAAEPHIAGKEARALLQGNIRRVLHRHRSFPQAKWALPEETLHHLDALHERFAPQDALERRAWLFCSAAVLPDRGADGWEAERRAIDEVRRGSARELLDSLGREALLGLARIVDAPVSIGMALIDSGVPATEIDALIETAVRSENSRERDLAAGLIVSSFRDRRKPWAEDLLAKARSGGWGERALLAILHSLPFENWTWAQATSCGNTVETAYWQETSVFQPTGNGEDTARAIRMLINVGRAREALALAAPGIGSSLATELLVELLRKAADKPLRSQEDSNERTMFEYYVAEILKHLDTREDLDREVLITLEWKYLQLLEHSQRPAKAILAALSERPPLFLQMLSAVFRASDEEEQDNSQPVIDDEERRVGAQALRLFDLWNVVPGTRDDGTIDGAKLDAWVREARDLAKEARREAIADSMIGNMLSASPMGKDGNWPAEPVREVLDRIHSKPMLQGFWIGKANRRGMTSRGMTDGGDLEREEAKRYRSWARSIEAVHRHTAAALVHLAEKYEHDAIGHDNDAQRLDWEY